VSTNSLDEPETSAPPVDKSGERVREMFAGVAPRYDLLNHLLSLNIDRWWRRTAVKAASPNAVDPILDVCTGTGDLAFGFDAAVGGKAPVTGTDFCREMLDVAIRKNERMRRNVKFLEADTLHLPFENDTFQLVSVAFGLRNVSDPHAGLREMVRVARPGGKVLILEFSRPRIPGLRALYLFYFRTLLPWIGQRVSKSQQQAYHYLPASVMQFPDGQAMLEMLRSAGLSHVTARPLTFGIATLYMGEKPVSETAHGIG
jgi:demethylmenaquinone methyltransferase/2-methoxy-6-polyprenyl-1,4-benzoquinol methylase